MPEPLKFQIGYQKTLDHLVLGIAGTPAADDKNRHDPTPFEPVEFQSSGRIRDHLIHGTINSAFLPIPDAMDLFSKGLDIQLLMLTHRGGGSVIIKRNAHIRSISDFKGKTVLISNPFSIRNMLFHRLLGSVGLKPGINGFKAADVSCEIVSDCLMAEIIAQDIDNDIAGLVGLEPFSTHILDKGIGERLCRTGDLWPDHPCGAFVMRSSAVNESKESVQNLLRLFIKAADALTSDPSSLLPAAARFLDLSEKQVSKIQNGSGICFSPDLLTPDKDTLETVYQYMVHEMNQLKPNIDLSRLINSEFIESIALETAIEN